MYPIKINKKFRNLVSTKFEYSHVSTLTSDPYTCLLTAVIWSDIKKT